MILAYALAHYFYPRFSNNHKAKLLHSSSLILLIISLIAYQFILQFLPLAGVRVLGYAANISVDEVIRLTNQKRQEAGATPLQYNAALTTAAKSKADHMLANDYWAHVAPDGTEPWKFFTDMGYKYRYAGENLARDFSNPQSAVDAWMASPSHRDNLLSGKYKEIGIAVVEGDLSGVDTTIIVQFFGTQLVDTTTSVPIAAAQPQIVASPTQIPIPTVTAAPVVAQISPQPTIEVSLVTSSQGAKEKVGGFQLLISPFETTRGISIATTLVLLLVLVIDGVVIARRNITRIGGRSFAHLAFLGMVLAIILIAKAGEIL